MIHVQKEKFVSQSMLTFTLQHYRGKHSKVYFGPPRTLVDGTSAGTTNIQTIFNFCLCVLKHVVGYQSHIVPYVGF